MRVAAANVLLLSAAVTVTSAGRSFQDVVTEDGTYYTMSLYQASGAVFILLVLQHKCYASPVLRNCHKTGHRKCSVTYFI